MNGKIKKNWPILLISIVSMLMICHISINSIRYFFVTIFKNINEHVAYLLITGCVLIIIITIICLTIIICKCLSTGDKNSSPYEEALIKMLAPYDDKGNKGNNNSNNESTSS